MANKSRYFPATPGYAELIKEFTGCPDHVVYQVEEAMRTYPGCSTMDHLTRAQLRQLALEAWEDVRVVSALKGLGRT